MATGLASSRDIARVANDLTIVLGQLVRRLRSEREFPLAHTAVLGRLTREGAHTTSALAKSERMRPQSMAQTVADLEAGGLVTRRPDPEDGRRILIEPTASGRNRLLDDRKRSQGWLTSAIRSELAAEEQQLLIESLSILQRIAASK
jgi:DNA-binding MarR family transcriptional regulator